MVQQRDVQGRIYYFKSKSECAESRIHTPHIPDGIRSQMVLVINVVPGRKHHVKIMRITAATADDSEYVPISPTPKKGYPIQLRLRSHTAWSRGTVVVCYPSLGPTSYLKIDEYYEVPIQMLQEATDRAGNPYVIYPKRQGGMAQLRDHVRNRDRIRSTSKSDHAGEETSLEGLKVERLKVEEHFLQTCWGVVTIAWTSLLQWFALHYVRD